MGATWPDGGPGAPKQERGHGGSWREEKEEEEGRGEGGEGEGGMIPPAIEAAPHCNHQTTRRLGPAAIPNGENKSGVAPRAF